MKKGDKRGIFSPNKKAAADLYKAITGKNPPKDPEIHGKKETMSRYLRRKRKSV